MRGFFVSVFKRIVFRLGKLRLLDVQFLDSAQGRNLVFDRRETGGLGVYFILRGLEVLEEFLVFIVLGQRVVLFIELDAGLFYLDDPELALIPFPLAGIIFDKKADQGHQKHYSRNGKKLVELLGVVMRFGWQLRRHN